MHVCALLGRIASDWRTASTMHEQGRMWRLCRGATPLLSLNCAERTHKHIYLSPNCLAGSSGAVTLSLLAAVSCRIATQYMIEQVDDLLDNHAVMKTE